MAHAIFHKRLHIAQFITAVVALAFHMIGFYRFFFDQHIDGIGQLNLIPGSRRRFCQKRPNIRAQHVATDNRQIRWRHVRFRLAKIQKEV